MLSFRWTSTFLDTNQSRVFCEAFGPRKSMSLEPLCMIITFLSGKSTAISPASSTPVGPPPMIRILSASFIFLCSASNCLILPSLVEGPSNVLPVAMTRKS
eukprot:Gb_28118 [translate_table: standard]